MGKKGDQDINYSQNKTLRESVKNGVDIYLFEVFEHGQYVYQGEVQLAGDPYIAEQKDGDGVLRKVWVFPLKRKEKKVIESNSERFLTIYNYIDKYMRERANENDKSISFVHILNKLAKKTKMFSTLKNDLLEFNDLRNAIVHERSDGHVIAEPHIGTVNKIEELYKSIASPKTVSQISNSSVETCNNDDVVEELLVKMAQKGFSQLPILEKNEIVGIFDTVAIVSWIGNKIDGGIFELTEITVEMIMNSIHDEDKVKYKLVSKYTDCFEAEKALIEDDVLLISENGKRGEKIIGFLNRWDLPKIYSEIGYR
ncbi:MAG TPA: CBS domain-containing protein [Bacteroidales bacterium]|nr:CBS domain-containing protein [Bacteroidales bacterium]